MRPGCLKYNASSLLAKSSGEPCTTLLSESDHFVLNLTARSLDISNHPEKDAFLKPDRPIERLDLRIVNRKRLFRVLGCKPTYVGAASLWSIPSRRVATCCTGH